MAKSVTRFTEPSRSALAGAGPHANTGRSLQQGQSASSLSGLSAGGVVDFVGVAGCSVSQHDSPGICFSQLESLGRAAASRKWQKQIPCGKATIPIKTAVNSTRSMEKIAQTRWTNNFNLVGRGIVVNRIHTGDWSFAARTNLSSPFPPSVRAFVHAQDHSTNSECPTLTCPRESAKFSMKTVLHECRKRPCERLSIMNVFHELNWRGLIHQATADDLAA
jgi:hypothetical protein